MKSQVHEYWVRVGDKIDKHRIGEYYTSHVRVKDEINKNREFVNVM